MTEQRKALHASIEQVREEDVDYLIDFVDRFLHPLNSPASEEIVFDPIPPGFEESAEIDRQYQQSLAQRRAEQSKRITQYFGEYLTRLGLDPNEIGSASHSWSVSGSRDKWTDISCSWFVGQAFNRLGSFHLKEQQIVTSERYQISETQRALTYKVRLLTPTADDERELRVPI